MLILALVMLVVAVVSFVLLFEAVFAAALKSTLVDISGSLMCDTNDKAARKAGDSCECFDAKANKCRRTGTLQVTEGVDVFHTEPDGNHISNPDKRLMENVRNVLTSSKNGKWFMTNSTASISFSVPQSLSTYGININDYFKLTVDNDVVWVKAAKITDCLGGKDCGFAQPNAYENALMLSLVGITGLSILISIISAFSHKNTRLLTVLLTTNVGLIVFVTVAFIITAMQNKD